MQKESTDWRKLNRRRGANEDWREVFFQLYRLHQFKIFELQDVMDAAEKFGLRIERESLRVKLSRYVRNEILEKAGIGRYKLTEDKGGNYFKLRQSAVTALMGEEQKEADMTNY